MFNKENTQFLEDIQKRFEDAVAEENWEEVNRIKVELGNAGFSKEEIELVNSMSEEDVTEYMHWSKKQEHDDAGDQDYDQRMNQILDKQKT